MPGPQDRVRKRGHVVFQPDERRVAQAVPLVQRQNENSSQRVQHEGRVHRERHGHQHDRR